MAEKWQYLFKEVSPLTLSRKIAKGICKHHGCKNESSEGRFSCETCKSRLFRLGNPQRYAYATVKESARKRHIPFDLSFLDFCEFDRQTGYVASKGRDSESLTIDRIDSSKPYRKDNIRAISWTDNCARIIEGMSDPIEPIAKAIALAAKDENWYKFKKIAAEVLYKVELLQAQLEDGFTPPPEEENPF